MTNFDKVLDFFVNEKTKNMSLIEGNSEEDIEQIRKDSKKGLADRIKKEIMDECSDEIVRSARSKIDEEQTLKQISELKELMIEGFVIAFFVGLAVNQCTEALGFWKATITEGSLNKTIILAIIFILISCVYYFYRFFKKAIPIYLKKRNKVNDEADTNK